MWVLWRVSSIVASGGLGATVARHAADQQLYADYPEWHRKHFMLSADDRAQIRERIAGGGELPLLSVVMPTFNTPIAWLDEAVRSMEEQLYPNWELCVADDCSTDPAVRARLAELAAADPRIRTTWLGTNGGIGRASNAGIAIARGEFVAFLDHDDVLCPEALYLVWEAVRTNPDIQMLYSDEDKLAEDGQPVEPHFKPSWDAELALTTNYLGHLVAIRRTLLREVDGFATDLDGAQDWDLLLRCSERVAPRQIRHIPRVLYHWRLHRNSTAAGLSAKPEAEQAQYTVIARALKRRGIEGEIARTVHGWRVRRRPVRGKSVSIVIPTRGRSDLLQLLLPRLAEDQDRREFDLDLVVVDQDVDHLDVDALVHKCRARVPISLLKLDGPFNFAQLCNLGVASSRGEFIVLLNDDVLPANQEWLPELITQAARPEAGIVGALLHYPDGRLQHTGILLGINGVGEHIWRGYPGTWGGSNGRVRHVQEMSAVTGACIAMRRATWESLGGMDEGFARDFNDIDLCQRTWESGLKVLFTPFAQATHRESATRGFDDTPEMQERFHEEERRYYARWGMAAEVDTHYNPCLTTTGQAFALSPNPSPTAPWRREEDSVAR